MIKTVSFLQKVLGTRFAFIRIVKVLKQIVSGTNYQFNLEVRYS